MADNYLENKYDALYGKNARKVVVKRVGQSLDNLLRRNRSCRGYQQTHIVSIETLKKIVEVNTLIPSARNQQVLRFRLVTRGEEANAVLQQCKFGGALPELHLPFEGTAPEAFIVICSCVEENRMVDIDLGISAQSMLLKAVDLGLNGLIVCAFNKENIRKKLQLPFEPLAVIAIGKSAEKAECVPISASQPHAYYRKNGIHYIPKVRAEDLIL